MKKDSLFRKYLFFMLCSALVVGTATFYFHISDKKKNTTTIIIDNNIEYSTSLTKMTETKMTTRKTTSKIQTSSVSSKHKNVSTTAETTEFLWLDINSASAEELMKLHGIGEKTAEEIIAYREKNNGFSNIEEIMKVSGIGEKTFEAIREHIYVIDPVYEDITEEDYHEEVTDDNTDIPPTLEELAPIDINTANFDTLILLPHVDEAIAEQIISFRENNGGFQSEYELIMMDGLTRSEVADIKEYIKIK